MTKLTSELKPARNFGYLFSCLSGLSALYTAYNSVYSLKFFLFLGLSLAVLLLAIALPSTLIPFSNAWLKLGDLMGKVVNPLVLGIIFFIVITPVALISRLFARDELRLKKAPVSTYWLDRAPPGPLGDSFKNQF